MKKITFEFNEKGMQVDKVGDIEPGDLLYISHFCELKVRLATISMIQGSQKQEGISNE